MNYYKATWLLMSILAHVAGISFCQLTHGMSGRESKPFPATCSSEHSSTDRFFHGLVCALRPELSFHRTTRKPLVRQHYAYGSEVNSNQVAASPSREDGKRNPFLDFLSAIPELTWQPWLFGIRPSKSTFDFEMALSEKPFRSFCKRAQLFSLAYSPIAKPRRIYYCKTLDFFVGKQRSTYTACRLSQA